VLFVVVELDEYAMFPAEDDFVPPNTHCEFPHNTLFIAVKLVEEITVDKEMLDQVYPPSVDE